MADITNIFLEVYTMQKSWVISRYLSIALSVVFVWSNSPCFAENNSAEYPDIKWEPRVYLFECGSDPRYIDYENGSDSNFGTKEKPWKHHPWDTAAEANAAACTGIHTYCFKKGVSYRGSLVVKESGTFENPIRLTVDPSWGEGKAGLYGSVCIKGGWKRCTEDECPEIPIEGRIDTWYVDLDKTLVPRMLWEIHDGKVIRIPIARTPNWEITNPDDPRSEWWELTDSVLEVKLYLDNTDGFNVGDIVGGFGNWGGVNGDNRITAVSNEWVLIDSRNWKKDEFKKDTQITNGDVNAKVLKISGSHDVVSRLIDNEHFTQTDPEFWIGATMWSEKEYMPKPDAEKVVGYDPAEHSLRIKYYRGVKGPGKYDRYYLENLPEFLDSLGEYYYADDRGRLFLRLPEDRSPNSSIIEAAKGCVLLDIKNMSNIVVSGLDLKFSNTIDCGTAQARHAFLHASAVRILGNCSNIKVLDSEISHAPTGVIAYPEKKGDVLDKIEISDNDIHDIDGLAIGLSNGRSHYSLKNVGARLIHVDILKNLVQNVGFRILSHWGLAPHAINIEGGEIVEIAGNVIDTTWGSGILSFNGSDYSRGMVERPLMRTLIHHNKVTNSLLGMQDYGGIASWMGGPSYVYCNISGNPVGYKHAEYRKSTRRDWYRTSCYGVGIYLDGQYKGYVFNNIMWGKNNNVNDRIYNSCAFNEAMGFMNTVFNNTMYRFGVGLHKGMTQHNRCYYLGNLMLDIGHKFIQQEPTQSPIEYDSLAYAKNVFHGIPPNFGKLGNDVFASFDNWQQGLTTKRAMSTETGAITTGSQVLNAEAHDFRLRQDSIVIDRGAKVFVPWALYAVVGEWGFFQHPADPGVILGENMNWNDEWFHRDMFQDIPRNNLVAHNIDTSDFEYGILENWVKGALKLSGENQYCDISDSLLKQEYNGESRVTVDMDKNNFLIEVVFKTDNNWTGSSIVCKRSDSGYALDIDENGHIKLSLHFGTSECFRSSLSVVNDSMWHHVIAEVDRSRPEGINIYVDGMLSNGQWDGVMNSTESLSNAANFTVGKTLGANEKYFKGLIDFLRVSRGRLMDAETTIEQLYKWELDGPFLRGFLGQPVTGKGRDAGAIEYLWLYPGLSAPKNLQKSQ
jgi:hypothetical protein